MRLNEISYNDASPIDGYGPGFFRVGGKVHHDALLLSGAGTALGLVSKMWFKFYHWRVK